MKYLLILVGLSIASVQEYCYLRSQCINLVGRYDDNLQEFRFQCFSKKYLKSDNNPSVEIELRYLYESIDTDIMDSLIVQYNDTTSCGENMK